MDRKWKLIASTFLIIVFLVISGGYWFLKYDPLVIDRLKGAVAKNSDDKELPPIELTTGFDPTQNPSMFLVEEVSRENKTLNLKTIWPQIKDGKKVVSKITCPSGVIKLINSKRTSTVAISEDDLFGKLESETKGNFVFSGICSDTKCAEINKGCELIDSRGK